MYKYTLWIDEQIMIDDVDVNLLTSLVDLRLGHQRGTLYWVEHWA